MPKHRALEWMYRYGRRYPGIWDYYGLVVGARHAWPPWCFAPLQYAYPAVVGCDVSECVHRLKSDALDDEHLERIEDVSRVGGLAAWRVTQGIYRFDIDLARELWDTELTGALPTSVLQCLPEWCVYVELPYELTVNMGSGRKEYVNEVVRGFFVFLEVTADSTELRLLLDADADLIQLGLMLRPTLAESLQKTADVRAMQAARYGMDAERHDFGKEHQWWSSILALVLYLCADRADIADLRTRPDRPWEPKRKGPALLCPRKPIVHDCGVRVGAALRIARQEHEASVGRGSRSGANGGGVIPHVRRAHWHHYWTGPRTEERRAILRWLSPILVGTDADAVDSPTVHE